MTNFTAREHLRANLEARLSALDFPPPISGYFDGSYLIDLIWPQHGIAVMLGWPGRDVHNMLANVGWRTLYFEGSEVFARATLETIGKAIGYTVPEPVIPTPTTPPILGGGFIPRQAGLER